MILDIEFEKYYNPCSEREEKTVSIELKCAMFCFPN